MTKTKLQVNNKFQITNNKKMFGGLNIGDWNLPAGRQGLELGTSIKPKAQRAFGLIEIVIAVSIITVALAFLFNVAVMSLRVADNANKKIQAANLLEEGYEAIRAQRDGNPSWTTFTTGNLASGTRCLEFVGGSYTYDPAIPETDCDIGDGFLRMVNMEDAKRTSNASDKLDQVGSHTENNARFFTITVKWDEGTESEELKFYLTNFKGQ